MILTPLIKFSEFVVPVHQTIVSIQFELNLKVHPNCKHNLLLYKLVDFSKPKHEQP
jgi:hypothetical protein